MLDISSGAISWASKLQKFVPEVKQNAIVETKKEAVNLVNLLKELNIDVERPQQVFLQIIMHVLLLVRIP